MRFWRLALGRFREIDGEGARLYGGRWNSPGTPMVYAATHICLACLEQLVHVSPERLPENFRAFAIELPDGSPIEIPDPASVTPSDLDAARRFGDAWAASLRSAVLMVPSVLVPARLVPGDIETEERNVLLNPRHASASAWRVTETPFRIDPRLRRAPERAGRGG